ncbi:hypothetical protein BTO19_03075 [Vibrio parahaemolyticus]|nr:hypothetical protein BMI84_00605 [Vibrio parahaemolyticus]OQT55288.1 hypothetical protein EN09_018525 [Vibrio parahaemolyticus]OQT65071.1 hypothetical protein EM93_009290 [Vibrio parahaemolyticus]OQT68847.1 hypothetical protein EM75_013725 [Vibrio parahaemolyticus]OQT74891.1 hypothetical protein EN07_006440 [Vibrio parahaemolyticus]
MVAEKKRHKKSDSQTVAFQVPSSGETVLHAFSAPKILLFFVLSLPKSVVFHLPDEFWLSLYFLSSEQLPVPDPFHCLNHKTR